MKRAGIYIRVSTERQADKVSPQAQEDDSKVYCEEKGYQVVAIYRDTEKYKSKGKMVEPSGTRSDRPRFLDMIRDIDNGVIDIVIAWREDRLYRRANRACLEISERVIQKAVEVELVKEVYNATFATPKAWAAGLELEAIRERVKMGTAGRLESGKLNTPTPPFGYICRDGALIVNPDEARFVQMVWDMYGKGHTIRDIQNRLIYENAPQRGNRLKYKWSRGAIRHILKVSYYHSGIFTTHWDGEVYEMQVPTIIDDESYQKVKARLASYKLYPAGNLKQNALAAGKLYCHTCNVRMVLEFTVSGGKRYGYYSCLTAQEFVHNEGCPGGVGKKYADEELWRKLWAEISRPGELETKLQARIEQLKLEEEDAEGTIDKIQRDLDNLTMERQWVINQAKKRYITEDDMKIQLFQLTIEENELRKEYNEKSLLTGNRAEKLIELARQFRLNVMMGYEHINDKPNTEEEKQEQYEFRRKLVDGIVRRVEVLPDKSLKIYTEFDYSEVLHPDYVVSEMPSA